MATIDNVTVKINVEGDAQIKQASANLDNLDKNVKKVKGSLDGFTARNISYQLQDMAVQAELGTSWFRILGQQLPQLLSGFGTAGAVIGTVAAIALPLLSEGLKAAGIDMRSLSEMTNDLAKRNQAFLDAQKANMTTLAGLGNSYGTLTAEAKNFFEIREKLTQAKADREAIDTVNELKKSYSDLSRESVAAARNNARFTPMGGAASAELGIWFRQFRKGVTEEQGYAIADMLKQIDAASPEKTVAAINNVLIYLEKAGPESKKFKENFEKTVEPLLKINEELIKNKTNIAEAAQQASKFAADVANIQINAAPNIGNARRGFDQITAARLEGDMKLAEFRRQMEEKNKDGVNRSAEAAAGEKKIRQETAEKIKDITNAQNESYRSATLNNDAKGRQLDLEGNIVTLQDQGRYALAYQLQYEQDILRNSKEHKDALVQINENLRKNQITGDQAKKLEEQANEAKQKGIDIADKNRTKRINDAADAQKAVLFEIDGRGRLIDYERQSLTLRDQMRFAYQSDIDAADKIAKLRFDQTESEKKINEQVRLGKMSQVDATAQIASQNDLLQKNISLEEQRQKQSAGYREFSSGWEMAIANYVKNAKDGSAQAQAAFQTFTGSLTDNLVKSMNDGKLLWKEFLLDLVNQLIRSNISNMLANLLGTGAGGGASNTGNILGSVFKGLMGFADGGVIGTNSPVLVGERGPEILMGAAGRTVIPNGGIGSNVTYNINAVDATSFKAMIASDPTFLYAVSEQGRRRLPGGM